MSKRMRGKIRLLKSKDGKPVTVFVEKQSDQVVSIKATGKNLTMSDFIGLGLLTMFLHASSLAMLIGSDNLSEGADQGDK